jgi:mannose/fructose-specific phosphotransferase system component IIA
MILATYVKLACAVGLAAGLTAFSAAAQQGAVTGVDITGGRPTSVAVSIKGKDARTVRKDVTAAANFVCRNFVGLKGISLDDVGWCADRSSTKAMKQYAAAVAAHAVADNGVIVLSAR